MCTCIDIPGLKICPICIGKNMFTVIKLKSGYAVQNTKTFNIVVTTNTKAQAIAIITKLNGGK